MRALSAFVVLTLALLNTPAWGGGWETSGSPAASPVLAKAAEYLAYTCRITIKHNSAEDQFVYTEVLEPKHFKNGLVHLVTPGFQGREFLAGHELDFWGRNPEDQFDGSLSLRLTVNLKNKGQTISKTTVNGYAPMKKGYVTTSAEVSNPQTHEWMTVSASCSPTLPRN